MKFAPPRCPRVGSFVALGVSLAAGFAADAASAVARQFGVTDYGAVADGKTPNPVAIRTASDRAGSSGRGIGAIPAARFF
jgi:polygalacturonase